MKNLNQEEQESLTAWTLASAAVESLIKGNFSGAVLPFNPILVNGFVSFQNHFCFYDEFPFQILRKIEKAYN